MAKKKTSKSPTLSALLQKALQETESIRQVARDTGLHHASLLRFMRGERSLVLDRAEKLIQYFGIECHPKAE